MTNYGTNTRETTGQLWNTNDSEWVNLFRQAQTFNDDGQQLTNTDESWTGTEWQNAARQTSTYDGNGNQTEELRETWVGSIWVNGTRSTRTYDMDNDIVEIIEQLWDGAGWINTFRTLYTYKMPTATEDDPTTGQEADFSLYPVPAVNEVNISLTSVKSGAVRVDIFDVLGRHIGTIVNEHVSAGQRDLIWSTGQLPAGLYLVRLQNGAQTISKSFVVAR